MGIHFPLWVSVEGALSIAPTQMFYKISCSVWEDSNVLISCELSSLDTTSEFAMPLIFPLSHQMRPCLFSLLPPLKWT